MDNNFFKFIQRRLYNYLNSFWGFTIFIVFIYCFLYPLFSFIFSLCYLLFIRFFQFISTPISNDHKILCSSLRGFTFNEVIRYRCSIAKDNSKNNLLNKDFDGIFSQDPIDIVYTWVNGSDPIWKKKKDLFKKNSIKKYTSNNTFSVNVTEESFEQQDELIVNITDSIVNVHNNNYTIPMVILNETNYFNETIQYDQLNNLNETLVEDLENDKKEENRYRDSNELKYSLRSIVKNAPWVRHIYLVTDNQIPSWLNLETDKLTVVSHSEIFLNKSHLPVFSSPAIEANLHRIPGLSKKFIYFNDDVFLGAPVLPSDFVDVKGSQKLYMSWDIPKCAPGCSDSWIGDGFCDLACNVESCNFDYPDCVNGPKGTTNNNNNNNNNDNRDNNGVSDPVVHCVEGCPDTWLADRACDAKCNCEECGFDIGDCGLDLLTENYPLAKLTASNILVYIYVKPEDVVNEVEDPDSNRVEIGDLEIERFYGYIPPEGQVNNMKDDDEMKKLRDTIVGTLDDIPIEQLEKEKAMQKILDEKERNNSLLMSVQNTKELVILPTSPVLVVEQGTKGVYFDLSFFWEQLHINCRNYTNENQTFEFEEPILYSSAKYDEDSSGRLIHSSTLLTKHNLLFVLLFSDQETAPAPPTIFPHNVTFTIYGNRRNVSSLESQTLAATFILQILPKQDIINPSLFSVDNLIIDHFTGLCDFNSKKSSHNNIPKLKMASHSVLPFPFIENNSSTGIIFELLIPSSSGEENTNALLFNFTISDLMLSFMITTRNGTSYNYVSPLNYASMRFESSSVGFIANGRNISSDTKFGEYLETVSKSSGSETYVNLYNELNDIYLTKKEKENLNVIYHNSFTLLIHLPIPKELIDIKKEWIHSQVEFFYIPMFNYSNNAFENWKVIGTDNGDKFKVSSKSRISCISSVFKWGITTPEPELLMEEVEKKNEDYDQIKLNETKSLNNSSELNKLNESTIDIILSGTNSSSERRLLSWSTNLSFPSNVLKYFKHLIIYLRSSFIELFNSKKEERRRLSVDTYAMSLIHVNRLYNSAFGTESRKVPAHVPHMIDKDIMSEMQARWPSEWNATSSHRFRSAKDMQYSFSYYYYSAHRHKSAKHDYEAYIAYVVDTDFDKHINPNEFRTLVSLVKGKAPLFKEDVFELQNCVDNTSYSKVYNEETFFQYAMGKISKSFSIYRYPTIKEVLECQKVIDGLAANVGWDSIYATNPKLESDSGVVAFEMIGDNYTNTLSQLDSVRARQWKFVCINDNMDNPSEKLEKALQDFYESFFPFPSMFELPKETSNPTLYLDEYKRMKNAITLFSIFQILISPFSFIIALIKGLLQFVNYSIVSIMKFILKIIEHEEVSSRNDQFEHFINGMKKEIHQKPSSKLQDSSVSIQANVIVLISVIVIIIIVAIRAAVRESKKKKNQLLPQSSVPVSTQSQQLVQEDNQQAAAGVMSVINSPSPIDISKKLGIFRAPKTPSKREIRQKQLEEEEEQDDTDEVSQHLGEVPRMSIPPDEEESGDNNNNNDNNNSVWNAVGSMLGRISGSNDIFISDEGDPSLDSLESIVPTNPVISSSDRILRGGSRRTSTSSDNNSSKAKKQVRWDPIGAMSPTTTSTRRSSRQKSPQKNDTI